jgi:hypothetical protein
MIAAGAFPLITGFALSLLIVIIIYLIGRRVAPKGNKESGAKTDPYACGEDLPAEESRMDMGKFQIFASFFLCTMCRHSGATSNFALGVMPVIYFSIVIVAVTALMARGGGP